MRRAAAINIFERCDFDIAPAQLWRFVDTWPDPREAVEEFFYALGLDAAAIRDGNETEREQARDVLDLLVSIETSFLHLPAHVTAKIEQALFSGDYDIVRTAAEVVAIYERIAKLGARWPADERLAALSAFLLDIAAELDDPLAATRDDARAAEGIAATLGNAMSRFDALVRRQAEARIALRDSDPRWTSWPEAAAITADLARFDIYEASLRTITMPSDEIDDLLVRMAKIDADLEATLKSRAGEPAGKRRRDRAYTGATGGSSTGRAPSARDAAMDYFGFKRGSTPRIDAFKKRRRELQKRTHPDTGGSNAAFQAFTDHCNELRRQFGLP